MILTLIFAGFFTAHADLPSAEPEERGPDLVAESVTREAAEGATEAALDESGWDGVVEIKNPEAVASRLRGPVPQGGRRCSQSGRALWYGPGFIGHRTASGERFSGGGLTAAHRSFPLGTHVRVTNQSSGRSIVVKINDRGPFGGGIIDLSRAAANAIGMVSSAFVRLECY